MTSYLWERVAADEKAIVDRHITEAPVRVGEIARELGITVVRSPLPPKISGLIQPDLDAPSGFMIKVNKYESTERQRFTIAHEIAHFLLHRQAIGAGVIDSIMYRSALTSRKEVEANQLAADIVMPKTLVSSRYKFLRSQASGSVVEDLAADFKVSVPAMEVRLGVA